MAAGSEEQFLLAETYGAMGKVTVPKYLLSALNHLFEIDSKNAKHGDTAQLQRNIDKIKDCFEEMGLSYEDPMGYSFSETRTDLEATIAGTMVDNLVVVEVIKPIIRLRDPEGLISRVVQKGIVIVQSREEV